MGILDVLKLPAPARTVRAPDAAAEVAVGDDGTASWDDREVSEEEGADWIARGGAAGEKPAAPGLAKTFIVPVSRSVPIGRSFKYVELEKIDIEGELKFTPVNAAGAAEASGGPGIVPGKNPRVVPTGKLEVDLGKLQQQLSSELASGTQQAGVQVDPKLEFKVTGDGADVSIGIAVSAGWYSGSTKLVMVAKETGKAFQFANFTIEPISATIPLTEVTIDGVKGKVTGKIGATLVLKPAWTVIGAELAQKVGRPVASTALTVLGSQAFILSGFTAIAAAQAFAFVKSVSELQDIKAWAKAAENGWLSFRSGFGSVWGLGWSGGSAAGLRQAGVAAGKQDQTARMDAIREGLKRKHGEVPKDFGPAHLAALKQLVREHQNEMGLLVERSYRRQVIAGFLDAYQAEHGDDFQFKANFRALRTLLGVTS